MISPILVEQIFTAASIQRWNDYPRIVDLVELDKQAHKFIIAYFIAKYEKNINFKNLIKVGIFEFLRRIVVTDIRPDVFHKVLEKKTKQLNSWVITKLQNSLNFDENFANDFEEFLLNEDKFQEERYILKAASYISTRWEFNIIYQNSKFLSDIDDVKKAVEEEIEDYYELLAIRKIQLNKKLSKIIDLSGRLRFQKRWSQTPRIPQTSVLGHMLIVAILSFFYSLKVKACDNRLINNFFCALFHDFPEALTRDIISPVKYSVDGLDEIISEYEINQIEDKIIPFIPSHIKNEFYYLLGIVNNKKDEFTNRIYDEKAIILQSGLASFNENKYNAIDGLALKNCDRLAAFIEASISINYGVKTKELINGKKQTYDKIKQRGKVEGIDFFEIAQNIQEYFN